MKDDARKFVPIIDAQVHVVPHDAPPPTHAGSRPIAQLHVDIAQMVREMAALGVDRALVTGQVSRLGDNAYLRRAVGEHPERFAAIGTIDPARPDVDEQLRNWRSEPGFLGIRVVLLSVPQIEQWRAGLLDVVFTAAERHGVPMCVYAPKVLHDFAATIRAHPNLQFVLDHLGLPQPSAFDDRDPDPFQRLPHLLALSQCDNVAVKLSGAPTLSLTSYPYADLWPPLHRVIEAFGIDRVMWGTDWTRISETCTYAEAIGFVKDSAELSPAEKEKVMGGTLARLLNWP